MPFPCIRNRVARARALGAFLCALLFSTLFLPTREALAWQVSAGGGVLSEGDDRTKPHVVAGCLFGPDIYSTLFLYGQRFTIVSRTGQVLSTGKQWTLPFPVTKRISLGLGGSLLRETTSIGATASSKAQSDSSYNFGANVAFRFRIIDSQPFVLDFAWDAHVFPAGLATIFLTTGRRQFLSLTTGLQFK